MKFTKYNIIVDVNNFLTKETEWWFHNDEMDLYLPDHLYMWLRKALRKLNKSKYLEGKIDIKIFKTPTGITYHLKKTGRLIGEPYVTQVGTIPNLKKLIEEADESKRTN